MNEVKRIFKKHLLLILLVVLMSTLFLPLIANADTWQYYFEFDVTNNSSSDMVNIPVFTGISAQGLVDLGHLNLSGNNSIMKENTVNMDYGISTNGISLIIPSLLAYQTKSFRFYTGYNPTGTPKFIAGSGGYITVEDDPDLEILANGKLSLTLLPTSGNITSKGSSFSIYASSEKIYADIGVKFPEISNVATGTSVNPNSAGLSPTGGSANFTWISVYGIDGTNEPTTQDNIPSGYSNGIFSYYGISTGVGVGSAYKVATTSSEDPGAFTSSRNDDWVAYTVGCKSMEVLSTTSNTSGDKVNQIIYMPPVYERGELILVCMANDGNATVTIPSGWTLLKSDPNGTACRLTVFYKFVDETEGNSIAVTLSAAESIAYNIYRLSPVRVSSVYSPVVETWSVELDNTNLKLKEGNIVKSIVPLGGWSINDNSSPWIITCNALIEECTLEVSGTRQLWFVLPEANIQDTTLDDSEPTGGNNYGMITWGTNNSNLVITHHGFTSYESTTPNSFVSSDSAVVSDYSQPDNWFVTGIFSGALTPELKEVISNAASNMGMESRSLYLMIMIGVSIAIGLGVLLFTGSVIISLIVTSVMLVAVSGTQILDYALALIAIILMTMVYYLVRLH